MAAPVPRILLAFDHRIKMEKARHGVRSDDPKPEGKSTGPMTPEKRKRVAKDLRAAFTQFSQQNERRNPR